MCGCHTRGEVAGGGMLYAERSGQMKRGGGTLSPPCVPGIICKQKPNETYLVKGAGRPLSSLDAPARPVSAPCDAAAVDVHALRPCRDASAAEGIGDHARGGRCGTPDGERGRAGVRVVGHC